MKFLNEGPGSFWLVFALILGLLIFGLYLYVR